jgi:hypothetical protein
MVENRIAPIQEALRFSCLPRLSSCNERRKMKTINKLLGSINCSAKLYVNGALGLASALRYACFRIFSISGTVRLKASRHLLTIRGGTSDASVFFDIFGNISYRLPYNPNPSCIIDGGANAGYASVWYACCYPDAKIIVVEPDRDNLELLKKTRRGCLMSRLLKERSGGKKRF